MSVTYSVKASTTAQLRTEFVSVLRLMAASELAQIRVKRMKRDMDQLKHRASAFNDAADMLEKVRIDDPDQENGTAINGAAHLDELARTGSPAKVERGALLTKERFPKLHKAARMIWADVGGDGKLPKVKLSSIMRTEAHGRVDLALVETFLLGLTREEFNAFCIGEEEEQGAVAAKCEEGGAAHMVLSNLFMVMGG